MYRVEKARECFLARPGHMKGPASCAGGRENSSALQAPGVTRLCRKCEGSKLRNGASLQTTCELISKGVVGG